MYHLLLTYTYLFNVNRASNTKPLIAKVNPISAGRECEAECDGPTSCATGLLCFERGPGETALPPGCDTTVQELYDEWDYCYDPNWQDVATAKIWVIGASPGQSCDTVCSTYNSAYTCDVTQQYPMTSTECGELWKPGVAGYDSQKHERSAEWTVYPEAAEEGSEPGRPGIMPCQLAGNYRLSYMKQKDRIVAPTSDVGTPLALNCAATNNFGYPLCSCDTGAPEDPCPGLDCESQSDGCTSVTCDAATAQCVSTPIVTCAANKVCVDGYCSRDCDAFIIDDFLRDCSAEFEGNEGEISTLQTQVTALEIDLAEGGATEGRLDSIEAAIASNDGEIADIEADLAGPIDQRFDAVEGEVQAIADGLAGATETRFVTIETEITGIESRLDGLDAQTAPGGVVEVRFESIEADLRKFAAAHSQTGNVIGGSIERTAHSLWISAGAKDKLFMFLLILNTVLIVGLAIVCVLLNKSRNSTKYQEIYSTETDDENQRLQR